MRAVVENSRIEKIRKLLIYIKESLTRLHRMVLKDIQAAIWSLGTWRDPLAGYNGDTDQTTIIGVRLDDHPCEVVPYGAAGQVYATQGAEIACSSSLFAGPVALHALCETANNRLVVTAHARTFDEILSNFHMGCDPRSLLIGRHVSLFLVLERRLRRASDRVQQ